MRPMITLFIAVNVLFASLFLASPASALVKTGIQAADIELPDTEGGKHRFRELIRDKVALVVYWSVSCPHCRQDIPLLVAMAEEYRGNPFVMISVNADGPAMVPAAKAYAAEQKLPSPWLVDYGPNDSVPGAEAFDFIATPGIAVLDRTGKLVFIQELQADLEAVRRAVESSF